MEDCYNNDCCCCQGPPGPPGEPGSGITPAYFNGVYIGGSQDIPPEGDVKFFLDYQSGDFDFTSNTDTITVNKSGIYRIDYSLTLRPLVDLLNVAYAVAINEFENPLSFFGIYDDQSDINKRVQLTGMFITSIDAGSTVKLRNKSATADVLAGTGIDNQAVNNASIIIQRIG